MDLDLLKEAWQKTTSKEVEGYFISSDKMKEVIKKRSNTAVSQIKKGIFNKVFIAGSVGFSMLIFSVVAFQVNDPIFSFLESISNNGVGVFYLIFGLIICFISAFNAYSYQKIIQIEKYETDLRTSIHSVLNVIKKAIFVKMVSDAIVIPLTIFFFLIANLIQGTITIAPLKMIFVLLGAIIFGVFSFFLTKRGQNKRYGNQIKILEESLENLNT